MIHRLVSIRLYFLPVQTRVPLKFGPEVTISVTCARVALRVVDDRGNQAEGWGETPLSVQWVWPSALPYQQRHEALKRFCETLAPAWMSFQRRGHALELGHDFLMQVLPGFLRHFNRNSVASAGATEPSALGGNVASTNLLYGGEKKRQGTAALQDADAPSNALELAKRLGVRQSPAAFGSAPSVLAPPRPDSGHKCESGSRASDPSPGQPPSRQLSEPVPWLAALVCNSAFDLALHDAYGKLVGRPVYQTYGPEHLAADLTRYLEPAEDSSVTFRGLYPANFLAAQPPHQLRAWHLIGGLDPLEPGDLTGQEPDDGFPVTLRDWIQRDGLKCLKVKLRGNDAAWDFARLVRVGQLAVAGGTEWLTADFNCTVQDAAYVNQILDRLRDEQPRIYGMILYVEQPFPYDLESCPMDVHSVSARKPLFLDESAHDWRMVRLGRQLGWTGVALKTCKTQTGAILSACWAKAHGMGLMVQDLTNPMLAQIPHCLLAAHTGTIMGVETNAMQFYPSASAPEEKVHPGLYRRRGGCIDLSTLSGPGFGYRLDEIARDLPPPALRLGEE
jgi:L-alanine-DL-glutamate epimerase-like enolase superfamily enzyme